MTFVCVPITVETTVQALSEAAQSAERGADLVELRIDGFYDGTEPSRELIAGLVEQSPLPTVVTCRHSSEGGESELDSDEVVALYLHLAALPRPPRYVDIELGRAVEHAAELEAIGRRDTGVIVSMHDFEGRPDDLTRRLGEAYAAPYATVVKVAYRARSLRDNLELFEILQDSAKPTIALGMGEFGLMSRVLAPKFGGLLTFAALRDESATAPGQPTLDELFGIYRFRKIGRETKVYGVIGWPVTHSMSPLVHNAGFEAIGWDGVYLPLPVAADAEDEEGTRISFEATTRSLIDSEKLGFGGASVTLPHKRFLATGLFDSIGEWDIRLIGAGNTLRAPDGASADSQQRTWQATNTDAEAIASLMDESIGQDARARVGLIGAGGVSHAAAFVSGTRVHPTTVFNRSVERASKLLAGLGSLKGTIDAVPLDRLAASRCDLYINCTPVGMKDGPDPEGMSIPIDELVGKVDPETVFFDTVYNPIETPMLKAARAHGFRTIDGVQMFVAQAEAQFELWTGQQPPDGLFDRLVRERLSAE